MAPLPPKRQQPEHDRNNRHDDEADADLPVEAGVKAIGVFRSKLLQKVVIIRQFPDQGRLLLQGDHTLGFEGAEHGIAPCSRIGEIQVELPEIGRLETLPE